MWQGHAVKYQRISLLKFEAFGFSESADEGENPPLAGFVAADLQLLVERFKGRNREQQLIPALLGPGQDGCRRQRFNIVHRGHDDAVALVVGYQPALDREPQRVVGTSFVEPVEPAAASGNKALQSLDFALVQQRLPLAQRALSKSISASLRLIRGRM